MSSRPRPLGCPQSVHKLWYSALPLVISMIMWMFTNIGEPPPDINARVQVCIPSRLKI